MDDWTEVYERHGSLVWATVYRIVGNHAEALDCCQDIFVELLNEPKTRQVRDWAAFLKWLATRRALDRLRRGRAHASRMQPDQDLSFVPASTLGPDAHAISGELVERLKRELSRLPDRQAEAFWLLSVEQMSYEEIGEQLGVDANQVGVLVHRARHRLRDWLRDLKPIGRDTRPRPKTT